MELYSYESYKAVHEVLIFIAKASCKHLCWFYPIFPFSKQAFNESLDFCNRFITSWITQIWLTAVKLTCPRNTLRTSNLFARSDTGVVIDSKPHPNRTCKTSLLFAQLAVRVQAGCSTFPFYTPTKPFIRLIFKNNTVLIPKLKIIFVL